MAAVNPPAAVGANTATPAPRPTTASLYVGDLPTDLQNPEEALFALFNKVGVVVSIKVCRDINSQRSLGYAYVNFQNPADAETALKTLNFAEIKPGRLIRVMYSQRDPAVRKSGAGNLFVKAVDTSVDVRALHEAFKVFGAILSCKLAMDDEGKSRGYGFVHFEKEEAAQQAIERMNGVKLGGSEVSVALFKKKWERQEEEAKVFKNVFAKNVAKSASEEEVKAAFGKFGEVSAIFASSHPQHATQFVLVTFAEHESAMAAIDALHENHDSVLAPEGEGAPALFVCRALKKRDRLAQRGGNQPNLYQSSGRNVYIKHIDDTTTRDQLEEVFARFGEITSSIVMKDASGQPRGFGFVCFAAKDAATQAIREMNGKPVFGKRPLYVSQAMHRDMRHRLLEEQRKNMMHQQQRMMSGGMPGPYGPYGGPWGPMGPSPMGFGPRGPMMPNGPLGMMPGFSPMGPMRPGGPRGGGAGPMGGAFPRGGGFGPRAPMYQQPRNPMPQPGFYGGPPPMRGPMHPQHAQAAPSVAGITASDLTKMSPEEQKNTLGERLYAKIQEINPQQAAKITGMLLEMDTPEILNVLEDHNTLMSKVSEAVSVLRQHGTA